MWFKNAKVYAVTGGFKGSASVLAERWGDACQDMRYAACPASLARTFGWQPAWAEAPLVMELPNQCVLLCLRVEEKILPPSVVRQTLQEEVKAVTASDGRAPSAKRRRAMQDDITARLLPRAFSRHTDIHIIIDCEQSLLWINQTSSKYIELLWVALKRSLPDLRVEPLQVSKVAKRLTDWLGATTPPAGIDVQQAVTLADPQQQKRVMRSQLQSLTSDAVQAFLRVGYQVKHVALDWREQMSFTLTDQLEFRAIRCSEALIDARRENQDETAQDHVSDLLMMVGHLRLLAADLLPALTDLVLSSQPKVMETETA